MSDTKMKVVKGDAQEVKQEKLTYDQLYEIAQGQATELQKLAKLVNEVNVTRAELLIQAVNGGKFSEGDAQRMMVEFLKALKVE